MTPKKPGLQAQLAIMMTSSQVDVLAHRIAEAVAPAIDAAVEQAIAKFLSRVAAPSAASAADGGGNHSHRPLQQLLLLPAGALVTPQEASLITGLPIESMKSKRRFESFPDAVRVGHRTIKWRMGDIRKYLKEQSA